MNDFSRHDLDALKVQVDLATLMRQAGIELKAVGKNLVAVCPWHDDQTASLVFNPAKQLYNCFGCEAKGDVLEFLQRNESLSFGQAVIRLRELAGSTPAPERGKATLDPGTAENRRHHQRATSGVYQVEPRPPFTGKLTVAIRGVRADGAARSRSETVRGISQTLALSKERAEAHLMEILDVAEVWVDSGASSADVATAAPVLSEAQKVEALQFLQAPELVDWLLRDMETLGYVGEELAKLLIYLVGVSRKLESPMSSIIRSQSGAGKSGLAGLVAQLVPPEDVVHYSRVSAHALAYAEKTAYKHKLLVMEERVGGEAADYYIRMMQSGHMIRQSVTIKDPVTGQMKAQEVVVEGPIAYIETTTASVLNAENTSRCFEVYLDESEAQTARIHQRQRQAKGLIRLKGADRQRILDRHHNAQRLLESLPVVIPYVEHLTFPTKWLRTRRDNERFLCLIEASAFLHQYQRPRKVANGPDGEEIPYIEATWDDYRLAYELAQTVLKASLHELSPAARDLLEQISGLEGEFTRREVREKTGWPQTRVVDTLNELEGMEYVARTAGSNGMTMRYTVICRAGKQGQSPLQHILHPDELRAVLEAKGSKRP